MSNHTTPKKDESPVKEELSEEQLDQVAGGGGQPHMIGGLVPAVSPSDVGVGGAPVFRKAGGEQKV